MSERTFIDTLFVIGLLNRRDQYHERAAELAARYEGRRFLITDAVLLEIGSALARQYRRQAAEVIEHFLTSGDVEVVRLTPSLFDEAFALYKARPDKEWSLIDCVSFVVMRRADIHEALTFDHHFVQAGFRALMREPE